MLIHWEVVQFKLALSIDGQPAETQCLESVCTDSVTIVKKNIYISKIEKCTHVNSYFTSVLQKKNINTKYYFGKEVKPLTLSVLTRHH